MSVNVTKSIQLILNGKKRDGIVKAKKGPMVGNGAKQG